MACDHAVLLKRAIKGIEAPVVIEQILTHLGNQGAAVQTPRLPPCRAPPVGLFH